MLVFFLYWGRFSVLLVEGTFTFDVLTLWRVFLCHSFFLYLVHPLPSRELIFPLMWRIIISKKMKFFVWKALHGMVNTLTGCQGRCYIWWGSWCCCLCKRVVEDLHHILWTGGFAYVMWTYFFDEFGLDLARWRGCRELIKKFPTHPPFCVRKVFMVVGSVYTCVGWEE